jgi:hypothetical protein
LLHPTSPLQVGEPHPATESAFPPSTAPVGRSTPVTLNRPPAIHEGPQDESESISHLIASIGPVPIVGDVHNNEEAERATMFLYAALAGYARFAGKVRDEPPGHRLACQAVLEDRVNQVLAIMKGKLDICEPVWDPFCLAIVRFPQLATPTSQSGCPETSYDRNATFPKSAATNLVRFSKGEYSSDRYVHDLAHVEQGATFMGSEPVYVSFDPYIHGRIHALHVGDRLYPSGFFAPVTSLVVDDGGRQIWVAGDVRVRGFDVSADSLQLRDILFVRNERVLISGLAVWMDWVVLGTERSLFRWPKRPSNSGLETDEFRAGCHYRGWASDARLNTEEIDWRQGRSPENSGLEIKIGGNISAVCAVGKFLAVASSDYPTIHVYVHDHGTMVAVRLIGHTMGITTLVADGTKMLYSGANDKVVKHWDIEKGECVRHFTGHSGGLSAIHKWVGDKLVFLFTGGSGDSVQVWDLVRSKGLFRVDTGESLAPVALSVTPTDDHLVLSMIAVGREGPSSCVPGTINNEARLAVYPFVHPAVSG